MAAAEVRMQALGIPDRKDVEDQLGRMLADGHLRVPRRAARFLEFIVRETLDGRGDHLKAYTIATTVFGRNSGFDAQNDPVVRIEAGRLRRELEHYYLAIGTSDAVIITIPRGGYRPAFELRPGSIVIPSLKVEEAIAEPRSESETPWFRKRWCGLVTFVDLLAAGLVAAVAIFLLCANVPRGLPPTEASGPPSVIISGFDVHDISGREISNGLRDEIVQRLAPLRSLRVLTGGPAAKDHAAQTDLYKLDGGVRTNADLVRTSLRLVRQSDGVVVWAESHEASKKTVSLVGIERSFAEKIATSLAQALHAEPRLAEAGLTTNSMDPLLR